MNKLEKILSSMDEYINNESAKEDELSFWLESYICDHYQEIEKENPLIARYLNDDVVDICEQTELGLEGTNFRKEIEEAYNEILRMMP